MAIITRRATIFGLISVFTASNTFAVQTDTFPPARQIVISKADTSKFKLNRQAAIATISKLQTVIKANPKTSEPKIKSEVQSMINRLTKSVMVMSASAKNHLKENGPYVSKFDSISISLRKVESNVSKVSNSTKSFDLAPLEKSLGELEEVLGFLEPAFSR